MEQNIQRAKEYQKKKQFIGFAQIGIEFAALLFLITSGWVLSWREAAESLSGNFYFQVTLYYGIFFCFSWLIGLPLSFYSGYRLEHACQLSNQSFPQWIWDLLKKTLLSFFLMLFMVLALYALINRFPQTWWIAAWAGFAVVSYFLGQLFPVLIVPLFYQYGRVENEALKERIFALVKRFNLPLENVYSLNLSKTTKKANAMFAGLGKTKRLVLADTLIQNFEPDEIESVVAHELGHYKNHDVWKLLIFSVGISWVTFRVAFHALEIFARRLGYGGARDLAAFPLLYLIFFACGLVLTPANNAFSRWREREADRFALKAAGVAGFIRAMEKLSSLNLADPSPNPVIEWWFYSHPSIHKRIRMARQWALVILAVSLAFASPDAWGKTDEKVEERENALKAVEERSRTQIMKYFLGGPSTQGELTTPIAIELYNQAAEFFRKKEYSLAREAAQDSLRYDSKNPFAYELLGDIAYFEQDLKEARRQYEAAFKLKARRELKEKILKLQKEDRIEGGLATYDEERFIIKYAGEERGLAGAELQDILRKAYRKISQDLGHYLKHKVIVILYDEEEFRNVSQAPHWSSGVYDGKIRLPAYQEGFTRKEIERIIRHELTHAFVGEMSKGRCAPWLNEGLAELEEGEQRPESTRIFNAALKTRTLYPIGELIARNRLLEIKDPLEAQLFYVQSHELVKFIVQRFGLFHVKRMLLEFASGKDSFAAVEEALKISPLELEKLWTETLHLT